MTGRLPEAPNGARILILDIEVSPMQVFHFGKLWNTNIRPQNISVPSHVMCFAAKWYGDKKIMYYSTFHNGRQEMLQALWDLQNAADVEVGYNQTTFDNPHINREYLENGFLPPAPCRQVDLNKTMKREFLFESHSLDFVSRRLDIGAKIQHEGMQLWVDCLANNPKAWTKFKRYCINDVRLTDDLYTKVRPWVRSHPNMAHDHEAGQVECPTCKSSDLRREGFALTDQGKFQRYCCRNCGRWSRGTHRVNVGGTSITAVALCTTRS